MHPQILLSKPWASVQTVTPVVLEKHPFKYDINSIFSQHRFCCQLISACCLSHNSAVPKYKWNTPPTPRRTATIFPLWKAIVNTSVPTFCFRRADGLRWQHKTNIVFVCVCVCLCVIVDFDFVSRAVQDFWILWIVFRNDFLFAEIASTCYIILRAIFALLREGVWWTGC